MPSLASRAAWLAALLVVMASAPALADRCPAPGEWQRPGEATPLAAAALFDELAEQQVILLGEQHDNADHHRWQLHTLAGLQARSPELVIGLEMLPREAQPALDAWVAGELDEAEFLAESDWQRAWGYDPALYWPILHFARLHRIPVKALNIQPTLRRRLAEESWSDIPLAERHGITVPAAAPAAYRDALAELYARHPGGDGEQGLARFITAQLAWDRAMATGLAEAAESGALVVGVIGQGHLRFGHGVPHQLRDLGVEAQRTLLPWTVGEADCTPPPANLAQAVFAMTETVAPAPPRMLGVALVPHEAGVEIHRVVEGSVAEAAGLAAGDVILGVAGEPVTHPADVSRHVRRQPAGTLLPLEVRRDGEAREVLARFPPHSP
ncbi:ChaN family lipoprotein [Halomonas sp. NO4]|uniref:ChaN family lipoprotein n=1 Tax=Halomonas sp. NO4 TaxID=2484813 RepID=UPI001969DE8B|nr:ChaN family lipoprotein [Halomonas sp. NO4]